MPAKSAKQERFMQAVANNPKFAKKVGVPVTVGKEFTKSGGGEMKESKAMVKKEIGFMKKKGAPKSMIKHEMKEAGMKKMAKGGYASGGMPMVMKDGQKVPAFAADGKGKMASGGLAAGHKSADGIAHKGKTKGKEVKMALGGMAARAASGLMGNKTANPNVQKVNTSAPRGAVMPERLTQQQAQQREMARTTSNLYSDYQKQKAVTPQMGKLTPAHFAEQAAQARAAANFQKKNISNPQGAQIAANQKNIPRLSPALLKNVVGKKAGGLAAGHKQADGVAKKGKTKAMQVKMAGGGKTKKYC